MRICSSVCFGFHKDVNHRQMPPRCRTRYRTAAETTTIEAATSSPATVNHWDGSVIKSIVAARSSANHGRLPVGGFHQLRNALCSGKYNDDSCALMSMLIKRDQVEETTEAR